MVYTKYQQILTLGNKITVLFIFSDFLLLISVLIRMSTFSDLFSSALFLFSLAV